MAAHFTKDGSNHAGLGLGAINGLLNGATVFSMHARVYYLTVEHDINGSDDLIRGVVNGGSSSAHLFVALFGGTPKLRVLGRSHSADAAQSATSTTTITSGRWWSLGGVVDIAGGRMKCYVDGVEEDNAAATFGAASYTPGTPTAHDSIGSAYSGAVPIGTLRQVNGYIADVAVWRRDIGAAGFAALAQGYSPAHVPADLAAHFDFLRSRRDRLGRLSLSVTGSIPEAPHPPTFRRPAPLVGPFDPPVFLPGWAAGANVYHNAGI